MKHERLDETLTRRLNQAKGYAEAFAERDQPESAEMWQVVAGFLAATWEEMRTEIETLYLASDHYVDLVQAQVKELQ